MAVSAQSYTLQDWESLEEDDDRELVEGRLEESEMPDVVHETVLRRLLVWLDAYFSVRGGAVFGAGLKFAVLPSRGRIPDLSAFRNPPPRQRGALRSPPDLIVEIVSHSPSDQRRDRIAKVTEYAQFGAVCYCIVDPDARIIEVYQLHERHYVRVAGGSDGVLAIAGFDGLSIDLDALWAEVDRIPPGD